MEYFLFPRLTTSFTRVFLLITVPSLNSCLHIVSSGYSSEYSLCPWIEHSNPFFFNSSSAAKAVHVSTSGSGTVIDIYVRLKEGYKISALAERIQKNVKEQVQNMTGTVVTRVNVHVCEIDLKKPAPAEQK